MTTQTDWIAWTEEEGRPVATVSGPWIIDSATQLERLVAETTAPTAIDVGSVLRLDFGRLEALDTVGALLLRRLQHKFMRQGVKVVVAGIQPAHAGLLEAVWRAAATPPLQSPRSLGLAAQFTKIVDELGQATIKSVRSAGHLLGFFGLICVTLVRILCRPTHIRFTSLVWHMEQTGLRALPILGMLSFLIGVVLAFQGADQLRRFGAEIYVVNLLGLSMLREIGILMTAIIVAGRSGSAFTAQIGTMKVNQEIDAMLTLGLDPIEILVIPRILALMLVMPLLTFYANMVGLLGGMTMSWMLLDITFLQFVKQMHGPLDVFDVTVAYIKAPIFALVIGMVGCYEGLLVSGSAESVGLRTTKSVVESIFLVIVLNALFSILFSHLHI
ncbi:phospholipid/cholesterol/gamma-HCH transport system permease protein [Azospirillaceae bacterium]